MVNKNTADIIDLDLGIGSAPVAAANAAPVIKVRALQSVEGEATNAQLQTCLSEFGFAAMTADEFLQVGIEELNKSILLACRAGTAFWAAQEALKNIECADGALDGFEATTPGVVVNFKDWITQAGLARERVYECIRLAKLYGRLPATQRGQLLKVGKKQALLLAGLPQEAIEEAAESGHDVFAEAEVLSYAELKAKVKQLEIREKNYDVDLERMRLKVDRLEKAREPLTPFLPRTEDIRAECLFYQEESQINLNSLRKLFEDVNIDPRAPEWRYQIEQVWLTACFVAAMAADTLQALRDVCAVDDLPSGIESVHMMTPQEAARWLDDAAAIKSQYEGRKLAREVLRADTKKKKRGRPTNS
ncbi:MAG: hypothetical protein M0R41_06890 [Methylobacter tundripaludum]|nr:hypothetical protein [Methylobacter tundripaludum]